MKVRDVRADWPSKAQIKSKAVRLKAKQAHSTVGRYLPTWPLGVVRIQQLFYADVS